MRGSKCWNRFCVPHIEYKTTHAKEYEFNGAPFIYIFVTGIVICTILVGLFFLCRLLTSKSNSMHGQETSINCSKISVSNESEFDSVTLNTIV